MEMEREPELTDVFTALFGEPEVIEGVGLAYSLKRPDAEEDTTLCVHPKGRCWNSNCVKERKCLYSGEDEISRTNIHRTKHNEMRRKLKKRSK